MDREQRIIGTEAKDLHFFTDIVAGGYSVALSNECKDLISKNRAYLEGKLAQTTKAYYGINTGFGSLCNVQISTEDLEQLQYNLVCSHACGMGEEVPEHIVSLLMLLKIVSLSAGYSGVRLELVEQLVEVYNAGIRPVIYQQGSLGASGDLAPLAHLSLALIGEGEVYYNGERSTSADALADAGIAPIHLKAKEGLALLNGTQFSTAYALWTVMEASKIAETADLTGALSADVFYCSRSPFDMDLHQIRPHSGQIASAASIRSNMSETSLQIDGPVAVQDPYSFRCMPQVHGASRDAISYVASVVLTEINSVTDNPSIFSEEDKIVSGGNFHAQPIALALDFLAIALSELASISERRIFQLVSGQRGLPPFLSTKAGLNSGFMIPQYTAASIVSQNKQLCTPASIDSIVSSAGQEDHVSMAANAATKCYLVVNNVWNVLGIEWMCAAQGLDRRRPARTSQRLEDLVQEYRKIVPPLKEDRILHVDMKKSTTFLKGISWNG